MYEILNTKYKHFLHERLDNDCYHLLIYNQLDCLVYYLTIIIFFFLRESRY